MPSTYTVNLGIEKPATGEQSGTWGDTVNDNSNILDEAINGVVSITLTSAGSSGSPNQIAITNGASSTGRNKWIEFADGGDLTAAAYVQLIPNDAEKICFIRNSLSGNRSVFMFQGTYNASNDLEIAAGTDVLIKFNGGGAGATVVNVYSNLKVDGIVATTADINGGTIDGTVIGGAAAAAVTGTTLVANTSLNISGDGATVTGIKDEDNMASNSPTKLATQQSIKAYVDSQVGVSDTLAEVLGLGNTTGGNNIETTTTDRVQFRDSGLYIFSSVDGQLDLVADTEIELTATTVDVQGKITVTGTVDGRDVAADGVTADAALPRTGGSMTGAIATNSTFDGRDVAADGVTADAALPRAGGAMTGAITTNSTFDGRNVSFDGAKLDKVAVPVVTGANVTAVNAGYHVVSAGGITVTLPASPSAGNYVIVKDGTGAAATTNFTVARNGSNIASSGTDLTFDKNFAEIVMTYVNSTIGWSV